MDFNEDLDSKIESCFKEVIIREAEDLNQTELGSELYLTKCKAMDNHVKTWLDLRKQDIDINEAALQRGQESEKLELEAKREADAAINRGIADFLKMSFDAIKESVISVSTYRKAMKVLGTMMAFEQEGNIFTNKNALDVERNFLRDMFKSKR